MPKYRIHSGSLFIARQLILI